MGRKKIEIKPLTDERNRNVTFLKRKAGLMKKAYELSVLCGVTVSILIFSNNGKPYEFSSGDFDTEVDRYNEYEGMIERRRAAEFEALAAAGDDSDDEDEGRSAAGGAAGKKAAGPTKSLKGKETFKARRVSRGGAHDDRRGGRGSFAEGDHSFVTGLLDDERANGDQMPQRPDSPTSAGLSYALGLHSQQGSAPSGGWNSYRSGGFQLPFPQPGAPYLPTAPGGALSLEANVPWGNQMITTYAWLQIQQAHQEQKRQLLEKQQQQLLELTSRSGGAFFRDILGGGGGGGGGGGSASGSGSGGASQSTSNSSWNEFVWPTAPAGAGDELPPAGPPPGPGPSLGGGGGMSTPPDDDLVWALSGGHAHHSAQHAHPQQHMQQQQGYFGDYPQGMDVLTPASLVDRKRTRDSDIRDLRHPDMHKRRK